MVDCLGLWLLQWLPLLVVAAILLGLRQIVLRPRLGRVGSPVPGLTALRELLDDEGRFRGVAVREEDEDRYGGGRYVRSAAGAEIRLARGLLDRADVDALVLLEHERGHARDLPAPRLYRLAVIGAFLVGLAIALAQPGLREIGTLLMWTAYAVALAHILRDEAAASAYALDRIEAKGVSSALRREALIRLGVGFGIYLTEWSVLAVGVVILTGLAACR